MTSVKISKSTLHGIKIIQECSIGGQTINQIITKIVDSEIETRNLAIYTIDGYATVGDKVIDQSGKEFTIIFISDKNVELESNVIDEDIVSVLRKDSSLFWMKKALR
jgi:hypothetical protein